MVVVKRDNNKVSIKVMMSTGWEFSFTHTCSDDAYAAFLERDLDHRLGRLMEGVREQAYNEGWSDKTKKNVKKRWFSQNLTIRP